MDEIIRQNIAAALAAYRASWEACLKSDDNDDQAPDTPVVIDNDSEPAPS